MDCDVLIVGFGPVGQLLSILLADKGWRVVVVERRTEPHAIARAVSFDGEAARIFAAAGLADELPELGELSREIEFHNGRGDVLYRSEPAAEGYFGWPDSTSFYQPDLEAALIARTEQFPNLSVLLGTEAVGVEETGEHVDVRLQDGSRISARWVVGCDGARSFVREQMDVSEQQAGFSFDWLVCDVVPHEITEYRPNNLQICDPKRPRTHASAGRGHRRWEFMLLPGESPSEMNTPDYAWKLLAMADVTPENATLERHSVYKFRSAFADRWRAGRLLLAGDAAHVMPPFSGQGMCSGVRDARNLSWRLDLVLRGLTSDALLDSYGVERIDHLQNSIELAIKLGRVICLTNEKLAAARDAAMLAGRARGDVPPRPEDIYWPIRKGVFGHADQVTGRLVPQARVASADREGLFDQVVGTGFVLMTLGDPAQCVSPESQEILDSLDALVVGILPPGTPRDTLRPGTVVDVDGTCSAYLSGAHGEAVLMRPDFYAFGADEINDLIRQLATELNLVLREDVLKVG
ncbi:bifunctional 3-(3-hydroxy-phenyl)propionate/3-hydroxycinnamic acid hydroxylase MhpA [Lentzea tibetensis]|uniref:bifunctional 3-(3-hydroxy-phenyl)propionate/3-hydroxycinnamic acid hydroxylase MhpA n=1 Tax=Lentzea tibetensis TaxID=2591470 RepID=UPI001C9949C1|nr:bifunctional 3-(3-hydroxy-phenyl)propionate/3-hydroxycinnamic acid hydroxylase [Lentzea tibetensis]